MNHSFNIEVATQYGVEEAILLENLFFWCNKNKANGTNFHDGYYWTYNSVKAFQELFPYMSKAKIGSALKHLESEGIIKTGNYNSNKYDHTLWYTVTEKGFLILNNSTSEIENSISENKKSNISESEISITDINTDNKPDINTDIKPKKTKKDFVPPTVEEVKSYCQEKGYSVDCNKFVEYYSVNNWRDKNNKPVKNWKLKLLCWNGNSFQNKKGSLVFNSGTDDISQEELDNINF